MSRIYEHPEPLPGLSALGPGWKDEKTHRRLYAVSMPNNLIVEEEIDVDLDLTPDGNNLFQKFQSRSTEILSIFGASKGVIRSFCANLRRLTYDTDERVLASKAKKFCESFSAKLLGTEHDPIAFTGAFHRWMKPRLCPKKRVRRAQLTLCESLFACKSLLGHATELQRLSATYSHLDKLSSSVPDDSSNEEVKQALQPILDILRKDLREKFERFDLTSPAHATGCNQSSRSVDGKAGYLLRTFEGCTETSTSEVHRVWTSGFKFKPSRLPLVPARHRDFDRRPKFSWEPQADECPPDRSILHEEPKVEFVPTGIRGDGTFQLEASVDYPLSHQKWVSHVLSNADKAVRTGATKVVHATMICEASMKIRAVTKGEAFSAVVVREWQKDVFSSMTKLGCFPSLDGQITADMVDSMLKGHMTAGSSDFQAATDLLNPNLTNWILDQLCQDFVAPHIIMDDNADKIVSYGLKPKRVRPENSDVQVPDGKGGYLYFRSLTPEQSQRIGKKKVLKMTIRFGSKIAVVLAERLSGRKTCGQLMGQGTSFPLLCLVNLGISIAAFKRFGLSLRACLQRVFINGDDRLANSAPHIELAFWSIATPVGLHRSRGKSHEHHHFAVINSQRYILIGGTWRRLSVLRPGLFFGIKKLEVDTPFRPEYCLNACLGPEVVPEELSKAACKLYLRNHGPDLRKICGTRELFLPCRLGGFGQIEPPGWPRRRRFRLTPDAIWLAKHLAALQPYEYFEFGPMPCKEFKPEVANKPVWQPPIDPFDAGDWEHDKKSMELREKTMCLVSQEKAFYSRQFMCCLDSWREAGSICGCGRIMEDCPRVSDKLRIVFKHVEDEDDERDWRYLGESWYSLRPVSIKIRECFCHGIALRSREVCIDKKLKTYLDINPEDFMSSASSRTGLEPRLSSVVARSRVALGRVDPNYAQIELSRRVWSRLKPEPTVLRSSTECSETNN